MSCITCHRQSSAEKVWDHICCEEVEPLWSVCHYLKPLQQKRLKDTNTPQLAVYRLHQRMCFPPCAQSTSPDADALEAPTPIVCHCSGAYAWITFCLFMGFTYWYVNSVLHGTELGQGTHWEAGGLAWVRFPTLPPFFVSQSFLTTKYPVL